MSFYLGVGQGSEGHVGVVAVRDDLVVYGDTAGLKGVDHLSGVAFRGDFV